MRRILCVAAALAIVAGTGLTASAGHSCCKPARTCCSHAKPSCGLLSLPKLQLPKLQLPKLDLFGCFKKTTCCQPAPKTCSGSTTAGHGEAVKAPKVEDAPPPPYEEKAPAPAPPKDDAKAEPVKKDAAKKAAKPEKKA